MINFYKELEENGIPFPKDTISQSLLRKDYELFSYALGKGCPCDSSDLGLIARTGNKDLLKFAIENGCVINYCSLREYRDQERIHAEKEELHSQVVKSGNLESVMYLNENIDKIKTLNTCEAYKSGLFRWDKDYINT